MVVVDWSRGVGYTLNGQINPDGQNYICNIVEFSLYPLAVLRTGPFPSPYCSNSLGWQSSFAFLSNGFLYWGTNSGIRYTYIDSLTKFDTATMTVADNIVTQYLLTEVIASPFNSSRAFGIAQDGTSPSLENYLIEFIL